MPRLKPLPVGPYAKRDDSKDVEDANLNVGRKAKEAEREADKQRKEKALNEWTHVLCLAIEDPDKSAEKVSRGLGWTLRDLLHTWNIHRDKPERIELGVALSCLAADVDSKKVKSEDLPRDGRAPEKLTAFLSQDPKAKSEKEPRTAAKRNEVIDNLISKAIVRNLIDKLAGRAPVSLRDAQWLIAAAVLNWPISINGWLENKPPEEKPREARRFALDFLKALVLKGASGMSGETLDQLETSFVDPDKVPGDPEDNLDLWVVPLVQNGDSEDISTLLEEASEGPGGLIISSSDKIFIEDDPVASIRHFAKLANSFAQSDGSGLLIFVVDAGFLQPKARIDRRRSLFNIHVLISALTSFAVLGGEDTIDVDGNIIRENLERWKRFRERCCIVMRDFCLIQSADYSIVRGPEIDAAIREICRLSEGKFQDVRPLKLGASVTNEHVLPSAFPEWVDARGAMIPKDLSADDFHRWTVLVKEKSDHEEPEVSYFITPKQEVSDAEDPDRLKPTRRGRGAARRHFTGGMAYLTNCQKSKKQHIRDGFDRAQRSVYHASRGRLSKDFEDSDAHQENMRAVAELREVGFEVMPVEVALVMLSNLPNQRSSKKTST